MARSGSKHPTDLELEILKVLWEASPLPVREVRARLEAKADRALSHSSVITMLNIMVRKGFLRRKLEGKSLFFTPKVDKKSVAGGIMGDLLSRVFDGSPSAMVLNLIENVELDADEADEVRRLISRKAKEQQK